MPDYSWHKHKTVRIQHRPFAHGKYVIPDVWHRFARELIVVLAILQVQHASRVFDVVRLVIICLRPRRDLMPLPTCAARHVGAQEMDPQVKRSEWDRQRVLILEAEGYFAGYLLIHCTQYWYLWSYSRVHQVHMLAGHLQIQMVQPAEQRSQSAELWVT